MTEPGFFLKLILFGREILERGCLSTGRLADAPSRFGLPQLGWFQEIVSFVNWPGPCLNRCEHKFETLSNPTEMEFQILQVLKQAAGTKFSFREIGKIVDRHEYRENPHWARPLLELLVVERLIWKEEAHYLYPTEEQQNAESERRAKANHNASEGPRLVNVN